MNADRNEATTKDMYADPFLGTRISGKRRKLFGVNNNDIYTVVVVVAAAAPAAEVSMLLKLALRKHSAPVSGCARPSRSDLSREALFLKRREKWRLRKRLGFLGN